MRRTFDVLIVGAGIVGAACALELASAGLSVGVIECDTVGSGATAAGMGHLVVMDDSEAQLQLTRYSQTLWEELVRPDPRPHEYTRCGTIWVAEDASEMQAVHKKYELYRTHGIPCEVLDERQLAELEPNVRPGLAGGLLVPEDSAVYPPRSAALLLQRALDLGAELIHARVLKLLPQGVYLNTSISVFAERLVIANGARVIELLPEVPVEPKKGHLVITDRYPGYVRHQLVELGYIKNAHATHGDSVSFNVQPRPTGQLLIGSSRQPGVATREVEHAMVGRMLEQALRYLPGLGELHCVRTWVGFRAASPDGLPLIGPHPSRPGVWLATGHEGLGVTTSQATARLLAAQLLQREPEIPVEPYLPSRFLQERGHGTSNRERARSERA